MAVKPVVCKKCEVECGDSYCEAFYALTKKYFDIRTEDKKVLMSEFRKDLAIIDYVESDEIKALGEMVIKNFPEFNFIEDYKIKIGYVLSYEVKKDKAKKVFADCKLINGTYTAYLPFDFIITFYDPNIYWMSDNQKAILMYHELKHIGVGRKGFKIEDHDIEDFVDVLGKYGLTWNKRNVQVPDILK